MVDEKTRPMTATTTTCPSCGKEIPLDSSFCCFCGASLSTQVKIVPDMPIASPNLPAWHERLWLWLISSKTHLVAVLVIICVAVSGIQLAILIPENQRAIQSAKTTAYDTGYDEGYSTGKEEQSEYMRLAVYKEGQQVGYDSGYSAGQSEGYALGKTEGYDSGYAEGKTAGYEEGYSAGQSVASSTSSGNSTASSGDSASSIDQTPSTGVGEVYVSNSGKIHTDPHCSGMKHFSAMSYDAAAAAGYSKCKKCYR